MAYQLPPVRIQIHLPSRQLNSSPTRRSDCLFTLCKRVWRLRIPLSIHPANEAYPIKTHPSCSMVVHYAMIVRVADVFPVEKYDFHENNTSIGLA